MTKQSDKAAPVPYTATASCPSCGKPITLRESLNYPGRRMGYCPCNPAGPVLDMPAAAWTPETDWATGPEK